MKQDLTCEGTMIEGGGGGGGTVGYIMVMSNGGIRGALARSNCCCTAPNVAAPITARETTPTPASLPEISASNLPKKITYNICLILKSLTTTITNTMFAEKNCNSKCYLCSTSCILNMLLFTKLKLE